MSDESPTQAAPPASESTKRRPRLDLGGGEKKRGRSMFGVLLGTLNKAKTEDKERNASDAAKKRQLIEQRLQAKLRKENESVRRAEEAKKDKLVANRKEEELCLKDSVYKLRYTHLPLLSNFLLTSDVIPPMDDSDSTTIDSESSLDKDKEMQDATKVEEKDAEKSVVVGVLKNPPRMHPPPLYYLPAKLVPAQERFLERRKKEVQEAIEKEWTQFVQERTEDVQEIQVLRQKVAEVEAKTREQATERQADEEMEVDDKERERERESKNDEDGKPKDKEPLTSNVSAEPAKVKEVEREKDRDNDAIHPDDEDAVEY